MPPRSLAGRRQPPGAFADEDRAGHSSGDGLEELESPAHELEAEDVALELQVLHGDRGPGRAGRTERGVRRIGIRSEDCRQTEHPDRRGPGALAHDRSFRYGGDGGWV